MHANAHDSYSLIYVLGHEATETGLAYAPVSQAHGHNHVLGGGGGPSLLNCISALVHKCIKEFLNCSYGCH